MDISYSKKSPLNWTFVKKWVIKCALMFCSSHKDIFITAGVSRKDFSKWGESVMCYYLLQSSGRKRNRYRWEVKISVIVQSCPILTVSNHGSCQESLLLDGHTREVTDPMWPYNHLHNTRFPNLSNNEKYFNTLVLPTIYCTYWWGNLYNHFKKI